MAGAASGALVEADAFVSCVSFGLVFCSSVRRLLFFDGSSAVGLSVFEACRLEPSDPPVWQESELALPGSGDWVLWSLLPDVSPSDLKAANESSSLGCASVQSRWDSSSSWLLRTLMTSVFFFFSLPHGVVMTGSNTEDLIQYVCHF